MPVKPPGLSLSVFSSIILLCKSDFNDFVFQKYNEDEPLFASTLLGPSYDELDIIVDHCLLPELNVGDWLVFDNMGSGTVSEQSAFTDFERPSLYNFMSFSDW